MRKFFKYTFIISIALIIVYLVGPKVHFEKTKILDTDIDTSIENLEEYIRNKESKIKDLKPGNEAKIIWANDSLKQKTEYAVVYLHGFSACEMEGNPLHRNFAKRYGCNLYLPRLEDHGRADTNSFQLLTPENYLQSAEDAIDIAKKLGDKVIVMACSSGCTLAAAIASAGEKIDGLIFYSPNIDIFDKTSDLTVGPWGKEITSLVMKGERNHIKYDSFSQQYWNATYHINGIFALKTLINEYMSEENFIKIKQPLFMGYYFKDEEHQDKVVSVKRMLEFYDQVGTPENLKRKVAFPEANAHVITSSYKSKEYDRVQSETYKFAEEILGMHVK